MGRKTTTDEEATMRIAVARRLLAVRALTGLSQVDFARMFGLTQSSYHKWESGMLWPNPVHVLKMTIKCDVTFDFIYAGRYRGMDGETAQRLADFLRQV